MNNLPGRKKSGPDEGASRNCSSLLSSLLSSNLDEAVMAAKGVAKLEKPPIEFLEAVGKIAHGLARSQIYEKLGSAFGMKAYGILEKALIEGSWEEREAAFRGLTGIGDKAAPHLKAFVQKSIRNSSLQDAIYFAIRAMASVLGSKAAPILKTWAKGKDITVACYGIEAMADTGDGSCGIYLIDLLGNKSNIIRDVAFRTIERIGNHLLPVLKEGLTSPDPSIRSACFILLGKVMSSKAIPAMKGFMESDNPELRLLVVKALQGIETDEAARLLTCYLSDPSYLVRDGAVRALTARGHRSIQILKSTIQEDNAECRRLAMKILVSIGGLEALLPIHSLLVRGTVEERLTAAGVLRGASDPFTLNALIEVLTSAEGGTAMALFDNIIALGPIGTRRILEFALDHPQGAGLFHWIDLLRKDSPLPGLPEKNFNPLAASAREISLRIFLALKSSDPETVTPLLIECSGRSQEARAEISATLSRALGVSGAGIEPFMVSKLENSGIAIKAASVRGDKVSDESLIPSAGFTRSMTFSSIVKQILDNEGERGIANLITDLEHSMTARDISPILKVYYEMGPGLEGVEKISHIIEKSGASHKVASILTECFEEEAYFSATLIGISRINAKVRKYFLDCIDAMIEAEGQPKERLIRFLKGNSLEAITYLASLSGKLKNQEATALFAQEICADKTNSHRLTILSLFAEKLTNYDYREANSARRFFSCLGEEGAGYLLERCEKAKSKTFNAVVLEFLEENQKLFPFFKEWVSSFKPMGDEARDLKNGILKCLANHNAL